MFDVEIYDSQDERVCYIRLSHYPNFGDLSVGYRLSIKPILTDIRGNKK